MLLLSLILRLPSATNFPYQIKHGFNVVFLNALSLLRPIRLCNPQKRFAIAPDRTDLDIYNSSWSSSTNNYCDHVETCYAILYLVWNCRNHPQIDAFRYLGGNLPTKKTSVEDVGFLWISGYRQSKQASDTALLRESIGLYLRVPVSSDTAHVPRLLVLA